MCRDLAFIRSPTPASRSLGFAGDLVCRWQRLVPFLAFPGPAVLVMGIGRFNLLKASRADEDPIASLVNSHSIQDIMGLVALVARLGANTFDRH